jgi:small subunit ribosomal protein S16
MSVSIRLRREGAKNRPYYKVVVADSHSPRDGKFIEVIGMYDPKRPGHNSSLNVERAEYWISKGAQPSDTVRSLIKKNKKQTAAAPAVPEPAAPESAATEAPAEQPERETAESIPNEVSAASPPAEPSS